MRDYKISLPRIMTLHPNVREEVINGIEEVEKIFTPLIKIRVVQALRTESEQNDIYSLGRTKPGKIVTNAKFGQSFHNYGLAFDFALMYLINGKWELSWDIKKDFDSDKIADWQEVVNWFKSKGWTWGGDFKSIPDSPHLEKNFGIPWQTLFDRYNKKMWTEVLNYVKI